MTFIFNDLWRKSNSSLSKMIPSRALHPTPNSLTSLLNDTTARTLLHRFGGRPQTYKLGGRGLKPSVEKTISCPTPDGVLAEAAHPAGAGEEGGRHVH